MGPNNPLGVEPRDITDYILKSCIADEKGTPIRLMQIGFEIDGKHMWVYQEAAQPANISGISVAHNALRDIWPSQTNTVNVEGKGPIKTLTFAANDNVQSVKLD